MHRQAIMALGPRRWDRPKLEEATVEIDPDALANAFGTSVDAVDDDSGVSYPEAYAAADAVHGEGTCYPSDAVMHQAEINMMADRGTNKLIFRDHEETTHREMAKILWQTSFIYEHQFHVVLKVGTSTVYAGDEEDWVYQKLLAVKAANLGPDSDDRAIATHMIVYCTEDTSILGLAFTGKACEKVQEQMMMPKISIIHWKEMEKGQEGAVDTANSGMMGYGDARYNGVYQFKDPNRDNICGSFREFDEAEEGSRKSNCLRSLAVYPDSECDRVSSVCGEDASCNPYHSLCELGRVYLPKLCTGAGTSCLAPDTDVGKMCDGDWTTYFKSDCTYPQTLFFEMEQDISPTHVDLYGVLVDHFPRQWRIYGCGSAVSAGAPDCAEGEVLLYDNAGYVRERSHNYYYRDYRRELGAPQSFPLSPLAPGAAGFKWYKLVVDDSQLVTEMEDGVFSEPLEKYPECTSTGVGKVDEMGRSDCIILSGIRFRDTELDATLPACKVTEWTEWTPCSTSECLGGGDQLVTDVAMWYKRECTPPCPFDDPFFSEENDDEGSALDQLAVLVIPGWKNMNSTERTLTVVGIVCALLLVYLSCSHKDARAAHKQGQTTRLADEVARLQSRIAHLKSARREVQKRVQFSEDQPLPRRKSNSPSKKVGPANKLQQPLGLDKPLNQNPNNNLAAAAAPPANCKKNSGGAGTGGGSCCGIRTAVTAFIAASREARKADRNGEGDCIEAIQQYEDALEAVALLRTAPEVALGALGKSCLEKAEDCAKRLKELKQLISGEPLTPIEDPSSKLVPLNYFPAHRNLQLQKRPGTASNVVQKISAEEAQRRGVKPPSKTAGVKPPLDVRVRRIR
eukprot:g3101.t1